MSCLKNRNSSSLHLESSTDVGTIYLTAQGLLVGGGFFGGFYF